MARIRTVKPSFFSSISNAELPKLTRLTYVGLWTYVDDSGRGVDDPRLVKAAVWPLDDDYPTKKVDTDLRLLAEAGKIERYEIAGRRYFRVIEWHHQRINRPVASTLPASPGEVSPHDEPPPDDSPPHGSSSEDAVNPHGADSEDSPPEGKGKEGSRKGSVVDPSLKHHGGLAVVGKSEIDRPQEPQPPRPADPLVDRLLTAWPEARRRRLAAAALAAMAEARRWIDERLLDEVVGHMLGMSPPPGTPRYLLVVAADWAQQRNTNLSAEALASMAAAAKSPGERAAS